MTARDQIRAMLDQLMGTDHGMSKEISTRIFILRQRSIFLSLSLSLSRSFIRV